MRKNITKESPFFGLMMKLISRFKEPYTGNNYRVDFIAVWKFNDFFRIDTCCINDYGNEYWNDIKCDIPFSELSYKEYKRLEKLFV